MAKRILVDSAGIQVSNPGADVASGNAFDLMMDASGINTRLFTAGFIIDASTTPGIAGDIIHGLGYVPIVWLYVNRQNAADIWVDTTKIHYAYDAPIKIGYVISFERWI